MATAFFKHEGFLCSSYYSDILLPGIKDQIEADGDQLIEHEPLRDVLILEFCSNEQYFTNDLNDLLDRLESCCFVEINEDEAMALIEAGKEQEKARLLAQAEDARKLAEAMVYREAHPELYKVQYGFVGNAGMGGYEVIHVNCYNTGSLAEDARRDPGR